MLDFDSAVPLYDQIVNVVKEDISNGKFDKQRKLPTEQEMSETYKVSRITIRRAIQELSKEGLVEKKQGKGTFVCQPKMQKTFSRRGGISFSELCRANGVMAGAKVLTAEMAVPESEKVRNSLGLKEGELAVRIQRLRLADEKPLVIEDNYFPPRYSNLLGVDLEHDSLYRYLREDMELQIITGELALRLIRVNQKCAKLLDVPRGTTMLQIDSCTYDGDGNILHTCKQIGYGEDFDFIIS